jgi:ribonuclease HI
MAEVSLSTKLEAGKRQVRFDMKIDERKCRYQTMSLFAEAPVVKPPPIKTTGQVEVFFDGGCLGNPGQKYGSFQVLFDGKQIASRSRAEFGHGTNNEAEFNTLKMALDEAVAWFQSKSIEMMSLSLVVETDSTIVRKRLVVKNVIFKKYPSSERMFALANECLAIMKQFGRFEVLWKGRENNVERFGH